MGGGSSGPLKDRSSLVRLLGGVDVLTAAGRIQAGGVRTRTLLAALALQPGRVVPVDTLLQALWGDAAPRTAPHALQVHISNLRRLLPPDLIVERCSGGYQLSAGARATDVDRFRELAGQAATELRNGRATTALSYLRTALEIWRGPPLVDVPWERFAGAEVQGVEELHRDVQEDLVEALLLDGCPEAAVGEAESLVRAEPFRERRWGQLILALYRVGRQADALERWRDLRSLLGDELGVEPGPRIEELGREILRHDAALGVAATTPTPQIRFARGATGLLAYQIVGDGPKDLLVVPGFGANLEIRWEDPGLASFYRRLARSSRVILMDRRGTGLSDRDGGIPSTKRRLGTCRPFSTRWARSERPCSASWTAARSPCAARPTPPQRVLGVVTYATWPVWSLVPPGAAAAFDELVEGFDDGLRLDSVIAVMAPSRADDPAFCDWFGRYVRLAAGGGGTVAAVRRFREVDIRPVLGRVAAPVLAMSRAGDEFVPPECARTIAAGVPHGRTAFLPGEDSALWAGDVEAVAARVEDFVGSLDTP
ncbi:DNA-binding SARP family transcriptional activator [Nocardioides albertanoniae]|uniref:DNA-binding SARP family transcriptional activator n=1 Tax=Nocardioides albertanoniae TaxID=1175486 RepID=A0A543A7A7_9ACTN|nr:BTAD domain-containing putative transcriptional regulator [Nocardioides albertanoniae]TQL68485.1 DNA-binding SARP family transcriptional activator [Nocardioides albertanoniae]